MRVEFLKVKESLEKEELHQLHIQLIVERIRYYQKRIESLEKEIVILKSILVGSYTVIDALMGMLRMLGFEVYYAGIVFIVVTAATLIGYEHRVKQVGREIKENEKAINTIYEIILEDPIMPRARDVDMFIILYGLLSIAIAIFLILF